MKNRLDLEICGVSIHFQNDFMTYGHASQHFKKMIVSEKRGKAHRV
jgi:hypothetical protein